MRHGGSILTKALEAQGVDTVYCVPGESYLAALDGLYDSNRIRTVVCRQEGGTAMMAEAYGKLTGRPGVCFVTRGPGATNASIGVHIAFQDSSPMVMFVGLPAREYEDREAFQDFDFLNMFRALGKGAEIITDVRRIPEAVSRAFHKAMSGRPGPVVLGLPEDMLTDLAEVEPAPMVTAAQAAPRVGDMDELQRLIAKSEKPIVIAGGAGWSAGTRGALEEAATKLNLPVGCAFRFQDYFDNRHACYAGHIGIGIDPALAKAVQEADLVLAIGARLGEATTGGYTLLEPPVPKQRLVHVHPDPDELGRVYKPTLGIAASPEAFTIALAKLSPSNADKRGMWVKKLNDGYKKFLEPETTPGAVKLEQVARILDDVLPENAIVTNGAGNCNGFFNRYFVYKSWRSQLAPSCGAMGYGLPAAIAAKLHQPERPVVAIAGDGCFMMNGQELATACQYGANIVVLVVNNGMYGTIRMHQEREYPGRVMATSLVNPDFAALARSYGAHGETVEETGQFRPALRRALEAGKPALIELKTEAEALTPKLTLSQVRKAAESRLKK
ncbi:MAG: thiamine pyrophosphate-binding protein [Hyphomicrobiaceae bacterium]